jgi:hypothetical protein
MWPLHPLGRAGRDPAPDPTRNQPSRGIDRKGGPLKPPSCGEAGSKERGRGRHVEAALSLASAPAAGLEKAQHGPDLGRMTVRQRPGQSNAWPKVSQSPPIRSGRPMELVQRLTAVGNAGPIGVGDALACAANPFQKQETGHG